MTAFQHLTGGLLAATLGLLAPPLLSADGPAAGAGAGAPPEEATLTSDQVRLLHHLRVVWVPVEAGAPMIDGERPFGSSEVERDMARILGHPVEAAHDQPDRRTGMPGLPAGLLQAVEILVDAGKLPPGSYPVFNAMRERMTSGNAIPPDPDGPAIPANPTFRFTVTADHLKLLAHANFNGPGFDVKRPYGDMTCFELDIADALSVPIPPGHTCGPPDIPSEQMARFSRLHGEMLFAFQAFLQHAQLESGLFVRRAGRWTRRDAPPQP